MIYLIDTNACVEYLRGKNLLLSRRMVACDPQDIRLCSIVVTELLYGAYRSARVPHNLAQTRSFLQKYLSLPFDDQAAEIHAQVWLQLAKAGTPIGPHDLQIGAIALVHGATVVTHNTAEFSRVPNLLLDDWQI